MCYFSEQVAWVGVPLLFPGDTGVHHKAMLASIKQDHQESVKELEYLTHAKSQLEVSQTLAKSQLEVSPMLKANSRWVRRLTHAKSQLEVSQTLA